jgi:hypothetical protein
VFLVERAVTTTAGTPLSNLAILGVTSMNPTRGTPATIARAVRAPVFTCLIIDTDDAIKLT